MKKYLNLFFAAMVAVVCSSVFVSCGDDDDEGGSSSALVGTWDIVSNIQYEPEGSYAENVNNCYWVFTENKLTAHDPEDAMNGIAVDYTYDSSTNKLSVGGFSVYTVLELTASTLKMESAHFEGYYNVITLKKR